MGGYFTVVFGLVAKSKLLLSREGNSTRIAKLI